MAEVIRVKYCVGGFRAVRADEIKTGENIVGIERLSPFSSLEPDETSKSSYAQPSTAIVPASSIGSLQANALEQRIAEYVIPKEQIDAVTKMYDASKADDVEVFKAGNGTAYAKAEKEAITAYKKKHPIVKRILDRKIHKGWKKIIEVPVPKSDRTELLETLVATKDIVIEGYERFSKLPGLISRQHLKYNELTARAAKLEDEIMMMEGAMVKAPEDVKLGEAFIGKLSEYEMLADKEKEELKASIREKLGGSKTPLIDKLDVRKVLMERISDGIAQTQANMINYNANLELARQELISVYERTKLIEEQLKEFSKTWLPALKHIDGARLRYDTMADLAESAAELIGLNKLRERDAIENIKAKAAIDRTRCAIKESRMLAETVEESVEETERLLMGKEDVCIEKLEIEHAKITGRA